jgi:hypothetical protein
LGGWSGAGRDVGARSTRHMMWRAATVVVVVEVIAKGQLKEQGLRASCAISMKRPTCARHLQQSKQRLRCLRRTVAQCAAACPASQHVTSTCHTLNVTRNTSHVTCHLQPAIIKHRIALPARCSLSSVVIGCSRVLCNLKIVDRAA